MSEHTTIYSNDSDLFEQFSHLGSRQVLFWSWKVLRMGIIFLFLSILKAIHNIAVGGSLRDLFQ